MQKIYQAEANIEIAGSAAKSMVDNLATDTIGQLVAKHGLGRIEPHDWVPLHQMCNLFNDVVRREGSDASRAFVAMGTRIAEQSEFPPEMKNNLTMPVMLMGWNDHYQANHRGGTLENVVSTQISDTEFELHLPGDGYPYPYDITYGMVFGFCQMLLPKRVDYQVSFDNPQTIYTDWSNGVVLRATW